MTTSDAAARRGARTATAAPCSRRAHVSKVFGGLVAVNDVDFIVPEKAIVSLIGPNGAGQDDVLQLPDRPLQADDRAASTFDGKDITAKRADLVTKAGIARTFQNIKLFRTMTVDRERPGRHALAAAARA